MAEIVGTAYVRVRAITTQLASDIRRGVDEGTADSETEFSEAGERAGRLFGDGAAGEMRESVVKGAREAGEDAGDELGTTISKSTGKAVDRDLPDTLKTSTTKAIRSTSSDTDRESDRIGRRSAKKWTDSFMKQARKGFAGLQRLLRGVFRATRLLPPIIPWKVIFGIPGLVSAAATIELLLAGVVTQIGTVVTAAAGAGLAFAGLFAAIVPAAAVLVAAFKTPSEAMEVFKEDMEDLAPAWRRIGREAQRGLLPALRDTAIILTEELTPALQGYAREVGTIVGNTAILAAEALTSAENQEAFNRILDRSARITQILGDVFVDLIDIMIPFFDAVMPLAEDLAEIFAEWVEDFGQFIKDASETGELSDEFEQWWRRAKLVGGALKDLFDALWNILQIGADINAGFFRNFADFAADFEEFTESREGRQRIKEIFENAIPVLRAVNRLLGNVIRVIFRPLTEQRGTAGIVEFIDWLNLTGVPVLEEIFELFTSPEMTGAIGTFFDAFTDVVDELREAGTLQTVIEGTAGTLEAIGKILSDPGVSGLIAETIDEVVNILNDPAMVTLVQDFVTAILDLLREAKESGAIEAGFQAITDTLTAFKDIITSDLFQNAVGTFGDELATIAALQFATGGLFGSIVSGAFKVAISRLVFGRAWSQLLAGLGTAATGGGAAAAGGAAGAGGAAAGGGAGIGGAAAVAGRVAVPVAIAIGISEELFGGERIGETAVDMLEEDLARVGERSDFHRFTDAIQANLTESFTRDIDVGEITDPVMAGLVESFTEGNVQMVPAKAGWLLDLLDLGEFEDNFRIQTPDEAQLELPAGFRAPLTSTARARYEQALRESLTPTAPIQPDPKTTKYLQDMIDANLQKPWKPDATEVTNAVESTLLTAGSSVAATAAATGEETGKKHGKGMADGVKKETPTLRAGLEQMTTDAYNQASGTFTETGEGVGVKQVGAWSEQVRSTESVNGISTSLQTTTKKATDGAKGTADTEGRKHGRTLVAGSAAEVQGSESVTRISGGIATMTSGGVTAASTSVRESGGKAGDNVVTGQADKIKSPESQAKIKSALYTSTSGGITDASTAVREGGTGKSVGHELVDNIVSGVNETAYKIKTAVREAAAGAGTPTPTPAPSPQPPPSGGTGGGGTGRPGAAAVAGMTVAAAAAPEINLIVTIGNQDITDIVDARISRSNLNMARAIKVRR